jgi:uncharacterized membrane protein YraQ (UPF0718 family)
MLKKISEYFTYTLLKLEHGTHLADAVDFFIYDTIKIFLLLSVIIFIVSTIRSFFPPEKTKRILSHKKEFIGNILAALLGIVTPFCSCSGGLVIGKRKIEKWVEEYVYHFHNGQEYELIKQSFKERLLYAKENTKDILKRVWLFILIAISIGGFIHGYVPEDFLVRYAGPGNPFAVPIAVLIGVPLYANAAGVIPIVYALMEKGLSTGTVLAFMMAVTALSFPEMIILRKVLKLPLLAVFVGIMTVTIIAVGYLFNAIL